MPISAMTTSTSISVKPPTGEVHVGDSFMMGNDAGTDRAPAAFSACKRLMAKCASWRSIEVVAVFIEVALRITA